MADVTVVEVTSQRTVAIEGPGNERTVLALTPAAHVLTVSTTGLQGPQGATGGQGPPGPAGATGPQGEPGIPGSGFQQTYTFATPATVWLATHVIPTIPNVIAMDNSGTVIEGDVSYPSSTQVRVEWAFSMAGTLTLTT